MPMRSGTNFVIGDGSPHYPTERMQGFFPMAMGEKLSALLTDEGVNRAALSKLSVSMPLVPSHQSLRDTFPAEGEGLRLGSLKLLQTVTNTPLKPVCSPVRLHKREASSPPSGGGEAGSSAD